MVDRIEKLDPKHYRVEDTAQDHEGQGQGSQEEEGKEKKERDKFEKGDPFLKKLMTAGGLAKTRGTGDEREEGSLSLSQRVLVLWGILDLHGKLRVPVIVSYTIVLSLIVLSAVLILGILWR